MPVCRLAYRAIWLAVELAFAAITGAWLALSQGFRPRLHTRTLWLQRHTRRVLRVFVDRLEIQGEIPSAGLLVSNHLSYLDILVLGSVAPAVFVSKAEIEHWPVMGWLTRMAGTIFVERNRRSDVGRISREIAAHLHEGHLVILFPEGTSSNCSTVLPFRSSLLEPVSDARHPLFAAYLEYELPGGSAANEVCYWGDMTFLPHVVKLLRRRYVTAHVRFRSVTRAAENRKVLARQLHAEVTRLKAAGRA